MPIIGSLAGGSAGGYGQRKGAAKVEIEFLVIAGGGGGGRDNGGGGGAGGFRTSTQEIPKGTAITVTVGDGGAGGSETQNPASPYNRSVSGNTSSISGSNLTTIESAGGGGGGSGNEAADGLDGGSGGGNSAGPLGTGAIGTGNTPVVSPAQGFNGGALSNPPGPYFRGGGGGASEAGNTNGNGSGGDGVANSITGSSVTYAGGGGGSIVNLPANPGGSGGGGLGATYTNPGPPWAALSEPGTDNLGGGGGGGSAYGGHVGPPLDAQKGGNGGKGVVILSVPADEYSGTTTGSPTVTDNGPYKVLKFTGSGSYTV